MEIKLTIEVIIIGAIIAQSIFATLMLIFSKKNTTSNRILAILILAISLWLIDSFLYVSGVYTNDPNFYFLPIYYSLGFGPLIFFYVKSITNAGFAFKKRDLIHFIPLLLQAVLYFILTFQSYETKRWYWFDVHQPFTYNIEFTATLLSLAIYLFYSIQLLVTYQSWVNNNFSEDSKIRLNWLKIMLTIWLLLTIGWLLEVGLRYFFDDYTSIFSVPMLGITAIVLAIGGLQQSNLSHIQFSNKSLEPNSAIDDTIVDEITSRMNQEKDFLNPDLTLKQFANCLNLPPRTVSNHINQRLGKTFIDFVNEYRVEEVKKKLQSGDKDVYSLLGIAMNSGFNSKSTFNRIFKKVTGKSPRQYMS